MLKAAIALYTISERIEKIERDSNLYNSSIAMLFSTSSQNVERWTREWISGEADWPKACVGIRHQYLEIRDAFEKKSKRQYEDIIAKEPHNLERIWIYNKKRQTLRKTYHKKIRFLYESCKKTIESSIPAVPLPLS